MKAKKGCSVWSIQRPPERLQETGLPLAGLGAAWGLSAACGGMVAGFITLPPAPAAVCRAVFMVPWASTGIVGMMAGTSAILPGVLRLLRTLRRFLARGLWGLRTDFGGFCMAQVSRKSVRAAWWCPALRKTRAGSILARAWRTFPRRSCVIPALAALRPVRRAALPIPR